MALTIDSTHLAESLLPIVQYRLDFRGGHPGRYEIYRVCAHAKVIHGAPTPEKLFHRACIHGGFTNREAMEWQPDQDDDLDEAEVIHHLNQQAATSPWLEEVLSRPNHGLTTTTLVTSVAVQSPTLTAIAQGRPISSFYRYSFRQFMLRDISAGSIWWTWPINNLQSVIPHAPAHKTFKYSIPKLRIAGTSSRSSESRVLWHLQFDFVDLLSPRSHPAWRPTRRRRTTLNPFHRVSSAPLVHDLSQKQHHPEAKRFNGVRYRHERRTWSAEMKPPKSKSKVYFGESQCQSQAARIVDVAYHYYGKPGFLNFPDDTPRELSSRVIPAGLDEECKLKFVKEQAKWLASEASKQPPSLASVHSDILVSLSGGFTLDTSELRSFSEIVSLPSLDGDGGEADDGISHLQPSLLPDAEAGSGGGNDWMEMVRAEMPTVGAMVGTSSEGQGELEWNVLEDARVDAGLCASSRPSSSVRITDGWDGAEHCSTLDSANMGNSSPLSDESQEWLWMNCLVMSPPAATITMPCSPGHFQDDVARALLEQQSLGVEGVSS